MPGFNRSRVVGVSDEELDEFICGICLEVFVNPVVTQCCQQSYCSECIHNWLSDNNTCPNDRKELSLEGVGRAPRLVYNLLNKMQVKCDFYGNGCESVVKMCELSQHIIAIITQTESVSHVNWTSMAMVTTTVLRVY